MRISVCIPTCNRAERLRFALRSISQTDLTRLREVLVIDNRSTDDTKLVVDEARDSGIPLKYFYEPNPGLLPARHRGFKEASGEILAFLDDDVRVDPRWAEAIDRAFEDPSVETVCGPCVPDYESTPPQWISAFFATDEDGTYCATLSLFDGGPNPKKVDAYKVFGCNYAIRRSTLERVGGFAPDCVPDELQRFQGNGESRINARLHRTGVKAAYTPQAAVHHFVSSSRLTEKYFLKRAFYQGVSDSYARIRDHGMAREKTLFQVRWLFALSALKNLVTSEKARRIKRKVNCSYWRGRVFHEDEVATDALLHSWVTRQSYLGNELPPGWALCEAPPGLKRLSATKSCSLASL